MLFKTLAVISVISVLLIVALSYLAPSKSGSFYQSAYKAELDSREPFRLLVLRHTCIDGVLYMVGRTWVSPKVVVNPDGTTAFQRCS